MPTTATETWDAIYRSGRAVRTWPSEDVVRFCARRLARGMRVLEAGCGNGANLWFLAREGYRTFGFDASLEAVYEAGALAQRHGVFDDVFVGQGWLGRLAADRQQLVQASGDEPFDAIIDCRASQHVPWSQHPAAYREYGALLRPGGWLFLLHLDDQTRPDALADGETEGEDWTWDDIAEGVYPHNGLVCMPPRHLLRAAVVTSGELRVVRQEQLLRVTSDGICAHTAIDAQKPEA